MKNVGKAPRFKVQRRLLMELPGLGKPGAMDRKPYPPGQHGQRRRKYSEFGLQLEEKQKLRFHYGVREEQFRRIIKKAQKASGSSWIEALVNLLEKRLDNTIFRLGFASSIPAARQMISHGKVMLNGKKVTIGSQVIKVGDIVTLKSEAYENQAFFTADQSPRLALPNWMVHEVKDGFKAGKLIDEPKIDAVPFPFDAGLVISYYSLRG